MSDLVSTPRTNALHNALVKLSEQGYPKWISGKDYCDMREHANQLETELSECKRSNALLLIGNNQLNERIEARDRAIDNLERELAEAQRDAERYRFLRGKSMLGGNQFYSRIMEIHDEEIDKARGA